MVSSWVSRIAPLPVHGVQFHPESIASEYGHLLLKNFLEIAQAWNSANARRGAANVSRVRKVQARLIRGPRREHRISVADRQSRNRRRARTRGSRCRLRADDVGRGDAVANGRAPHGAARARRKRRRDYRRSQRHARKDAAGQRAAGRDRRRRHRRRRLGLLQYFDLRGAHRCRRRRPGRQARQSRLVVAFRRRRRARRAWRQYRTHAPSRSGFASAKPASGSCSHRRIIRR